MQSWSRGKNTGLTVRLCLATVNYWTTYFVQSDFGLASFRVDRYLPGMSGEQP
jgi:hypothetical protein